MKNSTAADCCHKSPTWLGEFYGCNFDFDHCEALAIANMPSDILVKESELMQTKWFDYRRLHPMHATLLFIHHYTKAYKGFIRIAKDYGMAEGIKPFKGTAVDLLLSREGGTIWKARQTFDQIGIRYDFALRFIMTYRLEHGWLHAPRPAHLTDEDMLARMMLAWEDEQRRAVQLVRDPRYRVENFFGNSDQIAYETAVIAQIKQRRNRVPSLHNAIYLDRSVRFEEAIRQFSDEEVDEAINMALAK